MPAKPPEYTKLMLAVARQIESTPDGLMEFRNTCREQGHVRAFDLDKQRASDIIKNLQRRMIVSPGQYEKFVEILEIIGRDDVIKMLPGYQDYESKDTGNTCTELHDRTIPEKDDIKISISQSTDEVAGKVTDLELLKLSESISPDFVLRLGIFLGIPYPEIETLTCGRKGTYRMLHQWRKNVREQDQRQTLLRKLEEADLGDLMSACFGDGGNSHQDSRPLSRSSIISEKTLIKLASKMGEGWSHFGISHLGMSKVDIDHFKHDKSSMENKIFQMLYEWRRRNHADAKIGKLLDMLEESQHISLDSYNFILEELQDTE